MRCRRLVAGTFILALAILAPAIGSPVQAADKSEVLEESALLNAPITLARGIAIAEELTTGKAFFANVDIAKGRPRILVETNANGVVQTVFIDATSGAVLDRLEGGRPE